MPVYSLSPEGLGISLILDEQTFRLLTQALEGNVDENALKNQETIKAVEETGLASVVRGEDGVCKEIKPCNVLRQVLDDFIKKYPQLRPLE